MSASATAAIGERIRILRQSRDLTQTAFGKAVGAAQPTVSQWESGAKVPADGMQRRLADFFHVSHAWLFAELANHRDGRRAA